MITFSKKGKGRHYLEGGLKTLPLKVNLGLVSCLGIETLRTNSDSFKKCLIQLFTHFNSKFVVQWPKGTRYGTFFFQYYVTHSFFIK
jgi:hypothetical protein